LKTCDLEEFNNILGIANRRAVKEAILMAINVLLGKIVEKPRHIIGRKDDKEENFNSG
jgi:hypothetical protein